MKRFLFLLSCCGVLAGAADLGTARTVYVLSMSRGIDQFLANRLTNEHVFQVVTDPKLADVVFTDHLGESFQAQLESFAPLRADEEEEKADAKTGANSEAKPADNSTAGFFAAPVNKLANPAMNSTFGRNKGTFFLVDAKSREVLWSTFEPPRPSTNRELDRTASDIVNRLKKDLNPKKK